MDNFDLRKYLVENKVTTNSRMLTEAAEVPAWLKGKLEDVHVKPGQGSIFAKSVDEILKLAQSLLDKTNPKELDRVANSTGTLTMNVPGAGYNLVLPIEQAKKLPGAQESEVEKQEGPNKVKVPAITTTAPLTQFKTNELTVIVRPKKDEAGAVIPNEYIVLSIFPGDPDIPRASEWNGKYAVVIPGGKAELKEAQGYTAKGKEMELILNNFPSVSIDVDIENGVVTKVNGDIEKESIYSYDENNFAAALKPFKDAGVKVDYTPWTSSGGDDHEGYFNIDASSLNNAIASKKITIKSDLEDPEEYLVLAEGITFQDLENVGVDRVDLAKLEKFKNLISSLPVDQVVGFISNELKKDPAFHNNLMKKLNPSGKSTLGPMGDEDNWASAEYYKDR